MKNLTLIIAIIFFASTQTNAQDYKVIHVTGTIEAQNIHKTLSRGTAFDDNEKFQYKTTGARAVVINTKAGKRYILKGATNSTAYTRANLTPSMSNISSRAGGLNNRLDLKNHFDGKYVVLGKLKVAINSLAFPINDTNFFFIRYLYKGMSIDKKLYHSGDTLIIIKDSLLQVDNKPIRNENITEMKLIYVTKVDKKYKLSSISSSFYPVFPNEVILKEEVSIIVNSMKAKSNQEIINDISSYINEVYGKANKENVAQWYNSNF